MSPTTREESIIELIRHEIEPLKEQINLLPSREWFLTRMDETMAELKAIRQELSLVSQRTYAQDEKISALEKIHPEGLHTN